MSYVRRAMASAAVMAACVEWRLQFGEINTGWLLLNNLISLSSAQNENDYE
ncbi:hypothetical protein HCH_01523 [Hahella chejuensis KCTC 2396]|uniref:Uncharacterized protein n=1 Tax=Hahella chejuensis (strain KCTC 2396) TaxID=349521 RepID=Q2SLU3_HAHCH|nr:hypothetical protein [Hahella chejuensis]ABC28381.1 hypothetical protein HCH_01523 [Hahella chejuensis KCTC 2396]